MWSLVVASLLVLCASVARASPRFVIHVFAWNRRASLVRLLASLHAADYSAHSVDLTINIDGGGHPLVHKIAQRFAWGHGRKYVAARKTRVGLEVAVTQAWTPVDSSQHAFFFEDDTEVSPLFFKYTLAVLDAISATRDKELRKSTFGISLNTPRINEVLDPVSPWTPDKLRFEESCANAFLFQLPGSWGELIFADKWRQFLQYYKWRKAAKFQPTETIVPHSRTNTEWPRSWKRYLVELFLANGWVMHYPRYADQRSLSTHYREPGEHTEQVADYTKDEVSTSVDALFTVPLRTDPSGIYAQCALERLPLVSFYHRQVRTLADVRQCGDYTAVALGQKGWRSQMADSIASGCCLDGVGGSTGFKTESKLATVKHMTYLPQGNLEQQVAAFENALALAKMLRRTLIVPPLFFPQSAQAADLSSLLDVDSSCVTWAQYAGQQTQLPSTHWRVLWPETTTYTSGDTHVHASMHLLLRAYGFYVQEEVRTRLFSGATLAWMVAGCADDVLVFGQLHTLCSEYVACSPVGQQRAQLAPALVKCSDLVCSLNTRDARATAINVCSPALANAPETETNVFVRSRLCARDERA